MNTYNFQLTTRNIFFILSVLFSITVFTQSQEKDSVKYNLAPVLVTATEAKERETPVTFTNLNKGLIEQRYSMQDVPVLLSTLPSMISYSDGGNGIGYNYIVLRGFDQRRLSVMVNGVPQNDPEDHNVYWIDFPDILASASNVQVQRGAGSAFYGPPAIGGSVNIVTNPFTAKPYAKFESLFGFQEFGDSSQSLPMTMKKFSASFNSGLIDNKYMFYGHLGKIHSDGYRTQSAMDMNAYFFGVLLLSENMTTRIHFFGGPLGDQLVYNGLPKSVNSDKKLRRQNLTGYPDPNSGDFIYTNARRAQEKEEFNQPHYEVLNEWKISDKEKINNTVFFYDSHGYYDYDASWADTSMLRINHVYGFNTTQNITNGIVRGAVDLYQWGWLPRYELQHENGEFTIGAEYRYHKGAHWGRLAYGEGLPANYDPDYRFYQYNGIKHMASLYVTEIYHPQSDVSVMANVQFAYNEYKIDNEKFLKNSFSVPYYFLNPRLGINYNVTDEWNTYISFGYTSREPRLRNLYAAEDAYWDAGATPQFKILDITSGMIRYDYTAPLVKPEQLLDLELGTGYKTNTIAGTANFYWMEFTHELVKSGQIDIFGSPVYGNADRTRHIGFELDGSVRLPYSLLFSGNISLSSNNIVKFTTTIKDSTSGVTTYTHQQKLDGNPIAGFPDVMGNIRFGYQDEALSAFLSIKYVGGFYTDNFKNTANKNDAYTLINFESLYKLPTIAGTEFSIRAEVRNVFNTLYMQTGEGNQFYPAAERNYLVGITVQL